MPLTTTKIERLAKPIQYPKLHSDRDGLYLKHSPTGRKTWVYSTRKGGKWTVKKIGNFPTIPLNVARAHASQLAAPATHRSTHHTQAGSNKFAWILHTSLRIACIWSRSNLT